MMATSCVETMLSEIHKAGLTLQFSRDRAQVKGEVENGLLGRMRKHRDDLFRYLSGRHWKPFTKPGHLEPGERVESVKVVPRERSLEVFIVYKGDYGEATVRYFWRPREEVEGGKNKQ